MWCLLEDRLRNWSSCKMQAEEAIQRLDKQTRWGLPWRWTGHIQINGAGLEQQVQVGAWQSAGVANPSMFMCQFRHVTTRVSCRWEGAWMMWRPAELCNRTLNAVLEREAELQEDYASWQRKACFHSCGVSPNLWLQVVQSSFPSELVWIHWNSSLVYTGFSIESGILDAGKQRTNRTGLNGLNISQECPQE